MLRFQLWPGRLLQVSTPSSKFVFLLLTVMVWLGSVATFAMDSGNDHYREQVPLLDDAAERSLPFILPVVLVLCALSVVCKLVVLRKVNIAGEAIGMGRNAP